MKANAIPAVPDHDDIAAAQGLIRSPRGISR